MVDIVARKPLSYAGKKIAKGQTVTVAPKHAKLLIAIGKASLARKETVETAASAAPAAKKSKKDRKKERKNAYQTRALIPDAGNGE